MACHIRVPLDEASRRSPVTWLPSAMSRESVLSEAERGATSYQMSRRGSGYLRFTLSYRDVEDLLAERGIRASYETVRQWVFAFGPVNGGRTPGQRGGVKAGQ